MNSLQNMMEISLDILQQRQADDHEMKQQMESNIAHSQDRRKIMTHAIVVKQHFKKETRWSSKIQKGSTEWGEN